MITLEQQKNVRASVHLVASLASLFGVIPAIIIVTDLIKRQQQAKLSSK